MKIVHIGGRGSAGPAGQLFHLNENLELYVIEADLSGGHWGHYEKQILEHGTHGDFPVYLIQACISDQEEEVTFLLNHDSRSSSLLPMAETARDYIRWTSTRIRRPFPWDEVTETVKEIPLTTTTLDILLDKDVIPIPHVLSMDIQGSEYNALQGASSLLSSDRLLAVITEVEFRPFYQGQHLFGDITNLLLDSGLFFFEFMTLEAWWEGLIISKPFPAVAEALYMKDHRLVNNYEDIITLAAIAYSYGHDSYGYILSSKAVEQNRDRFNVCENQLARYVHTCHCVRIPPQIAEFDQIAAAGKIR